MNRTISPQQMKAGMLIGMHGGLFRITKDARPVRYQESMDFVGPFDCAVAESVCLSGEVTGYFEPGSNWNFQGNQKARFTLECEG